MNLEESINMNMTYLARVTKEPLVWEIGANTFYHPAPEQVQLGNSLLRTFHCGACGRCCKDFWNVWFESHLSISSQATAVDITVNGKTITLYLEQHSGKQYCPHQRKDNELCTIQDEKPLMCQMPPMKFTYFKNTGITYIGKQRYTHRWHVGRLCEVTIESNYSPEEIKADADKLSRVKHIAEDVLGIETYLNKSLFTEEKYTVLTLGGKR